MTVGNGGSSSSSKRSKSSSATNLSSLARKKATNLSSPSHRRSLSSSRSMSMTGERTVKRLRLSRALTVPETISVRDACRRMVSCGVDALLLTDSNALLCGILTDKDILTKVVAPELNLEETPVSQIMTRNPVFVLSDTLAVEALHKMVLGKFRHLPVVENGEVIALLDITKCLYDAISRMERAAEKGKAIAAAVEGVEKQWGTSVSGPNTFIEMLRDRMFRPSLSTLLPENSKVVVRVDRNHTVLDAAKKIVESDATSAIVTVENKPCGILTSKDMLMRVIAKNLQPESTSVEKVMTRNPKCATMDSPIVDALHIMHEGRFLHLPVVDKDGIIVSVVDVLRVTHAALQTVGNTSGEVGNTLVQKFWDSAMSLTPEEEDDDDCSHSQNSFKLISEGGETMGQLLSPVPNAGFAFKFQDKKGSMHRFICDTDNITDLMTAILQRAGGEIDRSNIPQILYEDEENDKVVIASDGDLQAAVCHARLAGWKGLRLHLAYSAGPPTSTKSYYGRRRPDAAAHPSYVTGAAAVA
ncbi:hypothetical protein M569_03205, partial [Genlisea aurea]